MLPVLTGDAAFASIQTWLIENHAQLAAEARERSADLGLGNVRVLERDAGRTTTYVDIGRADILLLCGVFGNISDEDIHATIDVTPQLLSRGGHLVWTRSRREPDITPEIRRHLKDRGFVELAFFAPDTELWSVGVNRFEGTIEAIEPGGTMFTFTA
ncbi:MAG TPA: SAM-dependent methyltransferase [Acidimicrobiia bacterium]